MHIYKSQQQTYADLLDADGLEDRSLTLAGEPDLENSFLSPSCVIPRGIFLTNRI
jgi:hypothetical protein